MIRSLSYNGNSIVSVLTPDVKLFDIHPSNWMQLSVLAESSRAFLQWTFEPENPSESIASKLSTEIKDIGQDFQHVKLEFKEDGNSKKIDYPLTWADWAYMVNGYKKDFTPIENSGNTVLVSEYLKLNSKERGSKVPVIMRVGVEGEVQYYKVGPTIIDACQISLANLKTLREWAGLYSEFPDKLKSEVNEELKKEYELKRVKFEKEVNDKVAEWEANYLLELKGKIKDKLLDMSGM
ncbi:MAG: hypothetical protein HKP14_00220 [Bacteroidia bacterium]|nr:hypothetical protein [Bacteroidia bacterium]